MKRSLFLFLLLFSLVSSGEVLRHTRVLPRTVVLTQTPRHSPLSDQEDYMGRWADYPLMMDTRWNKLSTPAYRVPFEDFVEQQKTVDTYLIDGFAFFPGLLNALGYFDHARKSPTKTLEVPIINFWYKEAQDIKAVGIALKHPKQYRYKGKILLPSYWTQKFYTPEQLKKKLDILRAKYGDVFYFIPDVMRIAYFQYPWDKNKGKLSAEEQAKVEETLRAYLRVADGLYFGETHMLLDRKKGLRRFHTAYYRDFVIRTMLKVLNEPEFKGKKLLALAAVVGHENFYGLGHQLSHDGTRTQRDSFQAVLDANPDLVMLPEWDESNENTSFRPTLYNGFVTKRLVRYFMCRMKNLPLQPVPGDDMSVPNLAVSFRKTLALGEELMVEVLQIPDGGPVKAPVTCTVELLDETGKLLKRFAPGTFTPGKLEEKRFTLGSEEFGSHRALQVALEVKQQGKTRRYTGFTPIELRVQGVWDYKFAKHALRDMLPVKHQKISRKGNMFSVEFESTVPLRSAALNLNGDIVYSDDPVGDVKLFRETDDHAVFTISVIMENTSRVYQNGKAAFSVTGSNNCLWNYRFEEPQKGNKKEVLWISAYARKWFLRIPAKDADKAVLHVDLPGVWKGDVDLKTVRRENIWSVMGKEGFQLCVSRFGRQSRVPAVLNKKSCRFTVSVPDDIPNRTVFFHAVGMDGKTWRSRPFVIEDRQAEKKIKVFSSHKNALVETAVPANRLQKLSYDFSTAAGAVLKPACGDRSFFGSLGSPYSVYVLRNRGQGTNGDPYINLPAVKKLKTLIPRQVKLADGSWALDFNGSYAAFPQDLIPVHSGFVISMEIFPREIGRRQLLFTSRYRKTPGSVWGILLNPGGRIGAEYAGFYWEHTSLSTNLKVIPEQWNKIVFKHYGDAIELVVNGKSSGRKKCCAPGRYVTASILGGAEGMFFNGMIRNFSVDHTPAE